METRELLRIPVDDISLEGEMVFPDNPQGLVIFAHGAGSSRLSPRNNHVAGILQKQGLGTLLLDLLTEEEDMTYENRFDIDLITRRMIDTTLWVKTNTRAESLPVGYFGASTGSAAAIGASIIGSVKIDAIVSRGGRPDLVNEILPQVSSPILLIVGRWDPIVIEMNKLAFAQIPAEKDLVIVEGATHLFEEPGKLDEVADLATGWFRKHLV